VVIAGEHTSARGAALRVGVHLRVRHQSADRDRDRAALALLARHELELRRTARRCSLCPADADDAFQRAVEILLTRAPLGLGTERLARWMQVVTRREALAVRRARERLLVGPGRCPGDPSECPGLDRVPAEQPGPAERAERRERFQAAARSLAALKREERLAIVLQASGYSYAEIAAACGWTYTKVNRALAEGRAKLRAQAG
jgi:RNA polymerase sigma factor (sigma-70 family)